MIWLISKSSLWMMWILALLIPSLIWFMLRILLQLMVGIIVNMIGSKWIGIQLRRRMVVIYKRWRFSELSLWRWRIQELDLWRRLIHVRKHWILGIC